MNIQNSKRQQRIEWLVKAALLGVIGFVVSPMIFIAIKGLVGLLIAAVVGLAAINATPFVAARLANWRLQSIKHEAIANPVETLQNDFIERHRSLENFKNSISVFHAEVMNFQDKLDDFKKQYPNEADKFESQLVKMKQLLVLRTRNLKDALQSLEHYSLEIKKADAIWQMGMAAAKMNKAAGVNEEDFYAKLRVETALDSVQKNLNSAFAELETSLLEEGGEASKIISLEDRTERPRNVTPSRQLEAI